MRRLRTWVLLATPLAITAAVMTAMATGEEAPNAASLVQARERAKLMHDVYASTLEVLHHHYFKPNLPVLPARAMEDVFSDISRKAKVESRWLAINTKAMSIDHEPKTDFDRKAATALSRGEASYEQVSDGVLHRVGAIPLNGGCVSCHAGLFAQASKTPRVAGLVISVPLAK